MNTGSPLFNLLHRSLLLIHAVANPLLFVDCFFHHEPKQHAEPTLHVSSTISFPCTTPSLQLIQNHTANTNPSTAPLTTALNDDQQLPHRPLLRRRPSTQLASYSVTLSPLKTTSNDADFGLLSDPFATPKPISAVQTVAHAKVISFVVDKLRDKLMGYEFKEEKAFQISSVRSVDGGSKRN